jgi:hypothetical protein
MKAGCGAVFAMAPPFILLAIVLSQRIQFSTTLVVIAVATVLWVVAVLFLLGPTEGED